MKQQESLENLPLALRELETCLEQSNRNVGELKESLRYVLERESALQAEHQTLLSRHECMQRLWAAKEQALLAIQTKRLSVIPALEERVARQEQQLRAEREKVQQLSVELQELHDKAQTERSASGKLKEDCSKYQSTVERLHQAMKQLNDEAIVWKAKVLQQDEELQVSADQEFTLRTQLDNEARKNERLEAKLQTRDKDIAELRKQIKSQETQLATLRTESQRVSSKNTELLNTLSQVGQDVEAVRQQNLAASGENKRLREELDRTQQDKEAAVAELSAQLADLERDLGTKVLQLQADKESLLTQQRSQDAATFAQVQELETACNEMSEKHREVLKQLQNTQVELAAHKQERKQADSAYSDVTRMRGELELWKGALLQLLTAQRPRQEDIFRSLLGVAPERSRLPQDQKTVERVGQITAKIKELLETPAQDSSSRMLEEMTTRYRKELAERKRLLRLLQDLRGNIRVMCRIRPLLKSEKEDCVQVLDMCQVKVLAERRENWFEFDRAFLPLDSQEVVFFEVADLVEGVLDGINTCIMAYGQTGSGKTHTMEGTLSDLGVNYRALKLLFDLIESRSDTHCFTLSMTVLEVYNEQIRTLLERTPTRLEIREDGAGVVRLPGLTPLSISSYADAVEAMELGKANRSVGTTLINEYSSRSHCIVSITVDCQTEDRTFSSKLNLIDLAGSERVWKSEAEGQRMVEACNINQSLAALGKVLSALASKQSHVPFRDSKLTHLLKDSLAGDAKTMVIVTVSPSLSDSAETLSALGFGTRVACVEKGKARPRSDSNRKRSTSRSRRSGSPSMRLDTTPNQYTQAGNGVLIPKLSFK